MRILFLCTGNSCRSQMAEGWTRILKGGAVEVMSAGVAPKGLDPLAVRAMREVGVDISGHSSKSIADIAAVRFDYVVTVCGHADESCPMFPAETKRIHFGFDDPPRLARGCKTEDEAMLHYRRVRDEIRGFVESLPEALAELAGGRRRGVGDVEDDRSGE